MTSYKDIHLIAARQATINHLRLNIDLTKQIDIFNIINNCRIPLNFQPLKQLSGVFIPDMPSEGIVAGILINEYHPRSRQRFTAAHEYCHYLRDNEISIDYETEIIARDEFDRYKEREKIAEAFAAWYLMPKQLVEEQSRNLGIEFNRINPIKAYQLSLSLGTSYSATVNHLYTLHKISYSLRRELLNCKPKTIKGLLDDSIDNIGWNDIWVVDERFNNFMITTQVGDYIKIKLKETPSTGYIWGIESEEYLNNGVLKNKHISKNDKMIGSTGSRNVLLNIVEEGLFNISLQCKRPWTESDIIKEY